MAGDPTWHGLSIGDWATWVGAAGSVLAATAAAIAAGIALRIANRSLAAERELREEEAAERQSERRRRAALHAAIVCHELHNLVAHSLAWKQMLADERFTVGELYDHVIAFKTPALDDLMGKIDYFEVGAAAELARLLNYYRSIQAVAMTNRAFIAEWSAIKRVQAKGLLATAVDQLVIDSRDSYKLAFTIARVTAYSATPEQDAKYIFDAQVRLRDVERHEADSRRANI